MRDAKRQLELPARPGWGGKRKGAGRKPKGPRPGVSHRRRPALSHRHPVHVTLRVLPHVWNLRSRRAFRAIGGAFVRGKEREGFRLVRFSVQGNHLHLVVEAQDGLRLSRGMQGLSISLARRLNRLMGSRGKVFADRFHAHVLRGPVEVARAIAYVVGNFAVHARRRGGSSGVPPSAPSPGGRGQGGPGRFAPREVRPDPYSSDGAEGAALTAAPRTWLLREGLRRGGFGG